MITSQQIQDRAGISTKCLHSQWPDMARVAEEDYIDPWWTRVLPPDESAGCCRDSGTQECRCNFPTPPATRREVTS